MWAQKTVVVLSDTHVMGPDLLVSDGTAWQNHLASSRKLLDYSVPIFDELIERLKVSKPDMVLLTGDLTKDGEAVSHAYVVKKLDELVAASPQTKVYVIPGNHDRGTGNAMYYDGSTKTDAEVYDDDAFATAYAQYGYGSESVRDAASLSYACEPFDGLVLIGIDSKDGSLSETTMDWVCGQAEAAREAGKQVVALMHHALIPHITNSDMLFSSSAVDDHDRLRNLFVAAGIKVVLTGHFHTSDIAKDFNDALTDSIYDVATGSTVSYPCDYRVMTLSSDFLEVGIETESVSSVTGRSDFTSTMAKERLHESIRDLAKEKADEKVGSFLVSLMKDIINSMANSIADAFVIHAEGNEAAVNTESIFDDLSLAFTMMDGCEDMAKSMLYDLAPYGVEGRENRTDDRTLTIDMPLLPDYVTLPSDGWGTYCSIKNLDLSEVEGVTAYLVPKVTASSVSLQEVSKIPAGTGFILHGTGGTTYPLPSTREALPAVTNHLTGVLERMPAPSNAYALSCKNGVTGFYRIQSGVNIPAHKAYLQTASEVKMMTIAIDEDETEEAVGIESVTSEGVADGAFYNLQGMKASHLSKGIYLHQGKKIIIQ